MLPWTGLYKVQVSDRHSNPIFAFQIKIYSELMSGVVLRNIQTQTHTTLEMLIY